MTTPTIFADGYFDSPSAFLNAPRDETGAARVITRSATVPTSVTTGQFIGLIPFQKGARVSYGSSVLFGELGAATWDVGYIYDDDTTFTNDPNAFLASAADNGIARFSVAAGYEFVAEADGWISADPSANVTAEDTVKINAIISYDDKTTG